MSNRYWISVGAIAVRGRRRRRVCRAHAEPARRAFARVGHVVAAAADARRTSVWWTRTARPPRRATLRGPSDPGVLRLHALPGCLPDDAGAAGERAEAGGPARCKTGRTQGGAHQRRSGARHAGAARQVHRLIRRRSYRPHRQRARDCEGHAAASAWPPRASICPAAATPWITRPRYSRSIPQARIVAVFTPPLSRRRADARPRAARARARARAHERDSRRRPAARSSRSSTCCRNTAFRAWCSRRRARASPAFKNALIRLFVRGFKPDMSDAVEREPTAYASFNEFFTRALRDGHASRGCRSARHRLARRRHGERGRHAHRRPPAAGQGPRIHAARAARRKRRLGTHLRRRHVRDYLPRALQLSPHPHAAAGRAARELLRARTTVQRESHHRAAGARTVLAQRARVLRLRLRAACRGPSSWSARSTSAAWRRCGTAMSRRANIAKSRHCP